MKNTVAFYAALALSLCVCRAAQADTRDESFCPAPEGASGALAAYSAAERLRFIRRTVSTDASSARLWSWGWSATAVAISAGQFTWGAVLNDDTSIDHYTAAVPVLLIPLTTLIFPLDVMGDEHELDALAVASTSPLCARLSRAEALFVRDAEDEDSRRNFFAHAIPILGSGAGALALGLGYRHWTAAATNFAAGVVTNELRIWTAPTRASRSLDRYRAGDLSAEPSSSEHVQLSIAPTVGATGVGLTLLGAF